MYPPAPIKCSTFKSVLCRQRFKHTTLFIMASPNCIRASVWDSLPPPATGLLCVFSMITHRPSELSHQRASLAAELEVEVISAHCRYCQSLRGCRLWSLIRNSRLGFGALHHQDASENANATASP